MILLYEADTNDIHTESAGKTEAIDWLTTIFFRYWQMS